MHKSLFFWLCVLIAALQAIDTALAVYFIEFIDEYNPVCKLLLEAGAWLFIFSKAVGLAVVVGMLYRLKVWREWAGWAAAAALAAAMGAVVVFQLAA